MIGCGSQVSENKETSMDGVVRSDIVHRVWHGSFHVIYKVSVRTTSGTELEFGSSSGGKELTDIKYVQTGDTVYYYYNKNNKPVVVRVGFAN